MAHELIHPDDWKVRLMIAENGEWYFEFQIGGNFFAFDVNKQEDSQGIAFHNWIGDCKPDVIADAMDYLS